MKKRSLHHTKSEYLSFFYHSRKGRVNFFRVRKSKFYLLSGFLFLFIITFFVFIYFSVRGYAFENKYKKHSHVSQNVESEIEILSLKMQNIQSALSQLESMSQSIKTASIRVDDRKHEKGNLVSDGGSDALGFGPLSEEEYGLSKKLTNVKKENLQFKSLFEEVESFEKKSADRLVEFRKLISDLNAYHVKLRLIPDLAPARGRLSSSYGWRVSPFSGKERMHLGLDIAAPVGAPIYATAEGTVSRVAMTEDYGRLVEVQHSTKLMTRYGHTSIIYVKEGQEVKKGDIIAAVGSSGRSTGPHVHYEIEVDGRRIDPKTYIVLW